MKNAVGGLLSRLDAAEERICDREHMSVETSQTEMQKRNKNENKRNIQGLWDNFKRNNVCVI